MWVDDVDAELNAVGSMVAHRTNLFGLLVKPEAQLVELVHAADASPADIKAIKKQAEDIVKGKAKIALRRSIHTAIDLQHYTEYVMKGEWLVPDAPAGRGPMAVAYLAHRDAVEVRLPSSARLAGERLREALGEACIVAYDDGMGRAGGRSRSESKQI